ncbi:hypothetical protein [Ferruginibacter sp.]|uniref:hypothetical protein n=1 Tax=Ferruginibacter sp. TaxID=1940288 RepID=UPI00265A04EB|nr:hypothetical protein [Ferruginibacter sp.]
MQLKDTNLITSQRWRDTCFSLLDKSATQIPSGYLIDYSLAPLNDSSFNGANIKNDTITESGQFFALHNIFAASKVNNSGLLSNSTDTLFIDAYRYKRNTGSIPLLFLYQPYQKIRSSALSQGLFTITTDSIRLKDVAGRSTTPYDNRTCFAFSPLNNIITQFNTITFALQQEFWLMNNITSVSIDFGDGYGARVLSKNGTVTIYYNTEGTKYLIASISTPTGTLTAKSSIQYKRPANYLQPDTTWNISVAPVYTCINQYLGITNKTMGTNGIISDPCSTAGSLFEQINCDINPGARVTVVNGCDRVFDKPIIIVEGFDPTDAIDYTTLNSNFDNYYSFNPNFAVG